MNIALTVTRGDGPLVLGMPDAASRSARVLWSDPASGVWRHTDPVYDIAVARAKAKGRSLPSNLGN